MVVGLASCEEFVMRQRTGKSSEDYPEQDRSGHRGGGGGGEVVDPHSGDHCVDVSYYGNVTYKPATEICCDTVLQKDCQNKRKKVSPLQHLMQAFF